jgi:hypothetical protein
MDKKPPRPSKEFIEWLLKFWLAVVNQEEAVQGSSDAHDHSGTMDAQKHWAKEQDKGVRQSRTTTVAPKVHHGSRKP